jgi:hypothetical protein
MIHESHFLPRGSGSAIAAASGENSVVRVPAAGLLRAFKLTNVLAK